MVLSMKQGNVAAPSRIVHDERIKHYFKHHASELEEHYRKRNVLKVNVLPENIAEAVLHFASEARSSRSTGNILNVDGSESPLPCRRRR